MFSLAKMSLFCSAYCLEAVIANYSLHCKILNLFPHQFFFLNNITHTQMFMLMNTYFFAHIYKYKVKRH